MEYPEQLGITVSVILLLLYLGSGYWIGIGYTILMIIIITRFDNKMFELTKKRNNSKE